MSQTSFKLSMSRPSSSRSDRNSILPECCKKQLPCCKKGTAANARPPTTRISVDIQEPTVDGRQINLSRPASARSDRNSVLPECCKKQLPCCKKGTAANVRPPATRISVDIEEPTVDNAPIELNIPQEPYLEPLPRSVIAESEPQLQEPIRTQPASTRSRSDRNSILPECCKKQLPCCKKGTAANARQPATRIPDDIQEFTVNEAHTELNIPQEPYLEPAPAPVPLRRPVIAEIEPQLPEPEPIKTQPAPIRQLTRPACNAKCSNPSEPQQGPLKYSAQPRQPQRYSQLQQPRRGNSPLRYGQAPSGYYQAPSEYSQVPRGYGQPRKAPSVYSQDPRGYGQTLQAPSGYSQDPRRYEQPLKAPYRYSQKPSGYAQDSRGYGQTLQAPRVYSQAPSGYSQAPSGYSQHPSGYSQDPRRRGRTLQAPRAYPSGLQQPTASRAPSGPPGAGAQQALLVGMSRPSNTGASQTIIAEFMKSNAKGEIVTARILSKTTFTGPSNTASKEKVAKQIGGMKIGKPKSQTGITLPKPSRLQRFDQTVSAELSRRKTSATVTTTTTSDTNLLEAVDKLAKAEAAHMFAGAVAAAEAAAAAAPNAAAAEEAAAKGARCYQAEIVDVVTEDVPGDKPIQVIGYVGITRPKYAAR